MKRILPGLIFAPLPPVIFALLVYLIDDPAHILARLLFAFMFSYALTIPSCLLLFLISNWTNKDNRLFWILSGGILGAIEGLIVSLPNSPNGKALMLIFIFTTGGILASFTFHIILHTTPSNKTL